MVTSRAAREVGVLISLLLLNICVFSLTFNQLEVSFIEGQRSKYYRTCPFFVLSLVPIVNIDFVITFHSDILWFSIKKLYYYYYHFAIKPSTNVR